jgi:quinol-cytochrome oxidoreductase complex cytochrome b subunit
MKEHKFFIPYELRKSAPVSNKLWIHNFNLQWKCCPKKRQCLPRNYAPPYSILNILELVPPFGAKLILLILPILYLHKEVSQTGQKIFLCVSWIFVICIIFQ